ncbi:MAG TPA: hypothetical protein VGK16_06160 [Candidatus Limnocylindrales bacterium]|jgi:hypothetical protein
MATHAQTASIATGAIDPAPAWPPGVLLRDIARGGLAGLVAGLVVGGIGGRVAMRAAALLVPEATGRFTENGNQIGAITLAGTLALVVFMGLFAGAASGIVWVTVRPWIPGDARVRAVLAMPIAVALGTFAIIRGSNPDFAILGHDPVIIAILIAVIALTGLAVAVLDGWLDRRLPYPDSAGSAPAIAYAALAGIGILLAAVMVVPQYLDGDLRPLGITLVVTGLATLAWWVQRAGGASAPARWTTAVGRIGLGAAVVAGYWTLAPELAGALGID